MSACLMLLALAAASCSRQPHEPRAIVEGGDAGALPRVQPADEHFDATALEHLQRDAAASGLRALVVLRHGYIIFDRYGHGVDAQTELDLGDFAQVLTALATGIAVHDDVFPLPTRSAFDPDRLRDAIESGTHQTYPEYLSTHLWRPLNAAPAWIALKPGAPVPADCCVHARLLDWMRVACLLVQDGHFEGRQDVPSGWIARMRQPTGPDGHRGFGVLLPAAAHGAEAFGADDLFFVRGPGHWRLWLIPSLELAVLFGAEDRDSSNGSSGWDETRLPNLVMRALSEPSRPKDTASKLQQLVPGH